jgi:TolA-binding protein
VIHVRKGVSLALLAIVTLYGTTILRAQQQVRPAKPPTQQQVEPTSQKQIDQINQSLSTATASLQALSDNLNKNEAELRSLEQQLGQINQKINSDDIALNKLQNIRGVTPEESLYLDKINQREATFDLEVKRFIDAQGDMAKSQIDMSGRLISIVPIIIATFAVCVTISLFLIKYWIDGWIKKADEKINADLKSAHEELIQAIGNKNKELDETITKRLEDEYVVLIAESCAQLAIPWWETYEKDYQLYLRKNLPSPDEFLRYILGAKALTERGRAALALLEGTFVKQNTPAFLAHAKLQNHWVYHATAEMICRGGTPAKKTEIIEVAEECRQLSEDIRIGGLWCNLKQTAAIALIQLGDDEAKEKGRRDLRGLLEGRTPGTAFPRASRDWLLEIWEECFPPDEGGRDLFGLGTIPSPVKPQPSRESGSTTRATNNADPHTTPVGVPLEDAD